MINMYKLHPENTLLILSRIHPNRSQNPTVSVTEANFYNRLLVLFLATLPNSAFQFTMNF